MIIEEAFQLIRTTPLTTLVTYYIGTAPFAAAILFFWADMSRSSLALRDAAPLSLILTALYLWMKAWHCLFCRKLWNQVDPASLAPSNQLSRRTKIRNLIASWCLSALSIPIGLVSAAFAVTIGWTYSAFHNVNVLAFTQDYGQKAFRGMLSESFRLSHYDWMRHKISMLVWWLACLVVFCCGFVSVIVLSMLAKSMLGIETPFTENPMTFLNSTFIVGVVLVTWLGIGPMTKAIYTLRCFYALSRTTGSDLLSRLASVREK